jgi:hypothetical protein
MKSTFNLPDGYQEQTLRSSSSQMWETPSTKACKKLSCQASRSRRTNWAVIPLCSSESKQCNSHWMNKDVLPSLHDHLCPKKSIKTPTTFPNDQRELFQQQLQRVCIYQGDARAQMEQTGRAPLTLQRQTILLCCRRRAQQHCNHHCAFLCILRQQLPLIEKFSRYWSTTKLAQFIFLLPLIHCAPSFLCVGVF